MKDYASELSNILFKIIPFVSSDIIKLQIINNVFNIYNIIVSPGLVYNHRILTNIFTVLYPFQKHEAFNFLVNFFNSSVFCVQEKI